VGERAVRVVTLESSDDVVLVGPEPNEPEEVAWGLAEFVANEELDRARGFWWAPDGESLLVERYDETGVLVWHISDPANPECEPMRVRYPQAGTANALVSLAVVPLSGARVDVDWHSDAALDGHVLEYLAHVGWSGPRPILTLLTRDQRRMEFRELDPATGTTTLVRAITDDAWVEVLPGTPRRLNDGRLLYSVDVGETRRLWIDGEPVIMVPDLIINLELDTGEPLTTAVDIVLEPEPPCAIVKLDGLAEIEKLFVTGAVTTS
jgi:dipeptidyl-peptidase-4